MKMQKTCCSIGLASLKFVLNLISLVFFLYSWNFLGQMIRSNQSFFSTCLKKETSNVRIVTNIKCKVTSINFVCLKRRQVQLWEYQLLKETHFLLITLFPIKTKQMTAINKKCHFSKKHFSTKNDAIAWNASAMSFCQVIL